MTAPTSPRRRRTDQLVGRLAIVAAVAAAVAIIVLGARLVGSATDGLDRSTRAAENASRAAVNATAALEDATASLNRRSAVVDYLQERSRWDLCLDRLDGDFDAARGRADVAADRLVDALAAGLVAVVRVGADAPEAATATAEVDARRGGLAVAVAELEAQIVRRDNPEAVENVVDGRNVGGCGPAPSAPTG